MGIRDGICIANSILCGFVRNSHFRAYPSHGYSKWNKYGFLVIMINDGIRKYPIDKPSCHSGGMKAPGAKPRCSICWQGAMPWACLSHNFRPSFVELWSKLLQNSCRNERNVEIALHILDILGKNNQELSAFWRLSTGNPYLPDIRRYTARLELGFHRGDVNIKNFTGFAVVLPYSTPSGSA